MQRRRGSVCHVADYVLPLSVYRDLDVDCVSLITVSFKYEAKQHEMLGLFL